MIVSADKATEILRAEGIAAIPTETVYGLAGAITSEKALKAIFETKKRPFFDPLIVHVADERQAHSLVKEWPEVYHTLAQAFWPGPLTLIAQKSPAVSDLITSGLDSVAIRCPNHPLGLQILRELKIPLAAPSANRFGKTSPTTAQHVETEFANKVAVVDGGACEIGVESTVLRATFDPQIRFWTIEILRPGGVSRESIGSALTKANYHFKFVTPKETRSSPGSLEHHYQPDSPLILVRREFTETDLKKEISQRSMIVVDRILPLELPEAPELAARRLYSQLRDLSAPGVALVFSIRPEHLTPPWEAILDRLQRASTSQI